MSLRWPVRARLYWCHSCNLPLAVKTCPRCGGQARRLELSEPGDARPALPRDYSLLLESLAFEFGDAASRYYSALAGRSPAILNKVPYFDEMREVYVDGLRIGRLYFDPFMRRWRFRPSRAGARAIFEVDPDAVEKVVVGERRILPPRVIRIGKSVDRGRIVFLARSSREPVGIAYSLGGGRARVHSWWGDGGERGVEPPSARTTIEDVVRAHSEHLSTLEARAVKTIAVYKERVAAPVVVSFSGGKDSHVALHLTLESGVEPEILFNDTGLELPETVDTVYRVADETGLELVVAKPDADFWEAVEVFGPPARDYRWCCKICKLSPLAKTVKSRWAGGALNIVAQRAFESIERARGSVAWRLRWAPYVLNVSPILYWSQFEEWLYIMEKRLNVNPLYYKGYERIGCFMCPASYLAEFDLVARTHPELWSRWNSVVERWAERLGMPREYVDYALWRWHGPAGHRDGMARKLGIAHLFEDWEKIHRSRSRLLLDVGREERAFTVEFREEVDLEALANQLSLLKPSRIRLSEGRLEAEWALARLEASGRQVRALYSSDEGLEVAIDSVKGYYRWRECVGCLSCEINCPKGAIKVVKRDLVSKPVIDESRCIGCRLCLRNCPIAEVFGEHVLAPILLGDVYAWTRASRESHERVLERARAMLAPKPEKPRAETGEVPESLADFLSSI